MARPVPPHPGAAAGPRAVVSSLKYALGTSGIVRGTQALLALNQSGGFDCPGCAWPDPAERSLAEFCENGARAAAHEADRRKVDAAFFAQHSIAELAERSDYELEQLGRLTEPVIKEMDSDRYHPIPWDDAFAVIAEHLHAAKPEEAVFYTSGRTSNEAAFLYQLFARSYGTNNLPDCSNMCHESSGKGLGSTIGVGKGTVQLSDFDEADLIFVIGQNPGTNHPRMLATLMEARARGAEIIAVNPLRERALESFAHPQHGLGIVGVGSPIASLFLRVKVNGDVALLKGIMKVVLEEERRRGNVLDRAFIQEHTTGFEDFVAALGLVSWDEIVEASGVPREGIEAAGVAYARAERTIICWAMGLTQHKNGVGNVREIVNLLLLKGNLGRPGAGACPVRGHSNVQGDRTMGIYEAPSEAWLARLDAGVGIRAPREHGYDTVAAIEAMEAGKVRVFFAMGGNFAAATPDSERTARALSNTGLTVQVSTKLNRSHLTTGKAALILPCLARSERDIGFVSVENSMGVVHSSQGNLDPASEHLLSEVEIVCRLAHATLDEKPVRWSWLAADYDRVRELIERSIAGFDRYNERVRERDGFVLINSARERDWKTATGKAMFTVQKIPRLDVRPGELVLTTIRSHDQFNTTIYALDDRYRGVFGERRVVFVSPEDLEARGLAHGDPVDIRSRHGETIREVTGFKAIAYDIPEGMVAAYFPEANPLVALEHHADESRTPASKSIVVTLSPAEKSA
jgi:molybdopterin-dependent oxidoreductase alpha subunit